jgi:hypothetical protein
MSPRKHFIVSHPEAVHWLALLLSLSFAKLIVFVLDSNPQVCLGDSMSYLTTAMKQWIPPDRSFVYGYVLNYLTARARSLNSLLAVQSFMGIATSMLSALILFRFFRVSFAASAAIAFLLTLEPQQLLYERFVMTESMSTTIFAVFLFLALEYLRTRKLWLLVAVQSAGVLLVAFRVSFVPMLLVATVAVPLFATLKQNIRKISGENLRQPAIHLVVSILCFWGLHTAYKSWNGSLSRLPPAYSYSDGFFLLSNVSPLVTSADTDNAEVARVLSQPLVYASWPEAMNSRNAEMFSPDGIVERLKAVIKNDYESNLEARRIAYHVLGRDPFGFVRLSIPSYFKFFSRSYMKDILMGESGMRPLGPDELQILAHYHLDAEGLPFMKTITRQYFIASWPFFIVVVNTPLVMVLALMGVDSGTRRYAWMAIVITSTHVAAVQVLGVEPSPRHLHAATVSLAIAIGIIAGRLSVSSGNQSRPAIPRG